MSLSINYLSVNWLIVSSLYQYQIKRFGAGLVHFSRLCAPCLAAFPRTGGGAAVGGAGRALPAIRARVAGAWMRAPVPAPGMAAGGFGSALLSFRPSAAGSGRSLSRTRHGRQGGPAAAAGWRRRGGGPASVGSRGRGGGPAGVGVGAGGGAGKPGPGSAAVARAGPQRSLGVRKPRGWRGGVSS